jgi:hypothetical protein
MKRKRLGRPKKSAKGQHHWWARAAACELRYALKLMRDGEDAYAQFDQFGFTVCVSCDPNNPQKFLRQMIKELDGKVNAYATPDYKIWAAWWAAFIEVFTSTYTGQWPYPLAEIRRAFKNGPFPTYEQWKAKFKPLWGNGTLPRDFVLQRSITRLGLPLQTR